MSVIVENLTKIYGQQRAVDQISFEAKPGQILGFLGPNGAGKSTTMKMLTCFVSPTSGNATVCGKSILDNPVNVRRHIGYLPEHNPLYKDMYVREFLQFVAGIMRVKNPKKRIEALIEMTGLTREQNKRIGALSKGYKQRVGLAQAMMHDPEVLILDEPTSGLDPNQLADIRSLIRTIGNEKTVLFSTHIMQEVTALCDHVVIINQGKLVADDPIEMLQNRVEQKDIIHVLFEKPIAINAYQSINGIQEINQLDNQKPMYAIMSSKDIRKSLFLKAVEQQDIILELKKEVLDIEDVFHQLTQA